MNTLGTIFSESLSSILTKLGGWWDTFVLHLPNLVLAIIVIAISFFLAGYARKVINKIVTKFTDRKAVINLLSNMIAGVLVFFVLIVVLNIMDLQDTVTSLLAGAGIVGLAIGLAFQEPIANTFAGIAISVQRTHTVGDHVIFAGYEGVVHQIGVRRTSVRTFNGPIVTVPNKKIYLEPTTNYTIGDRFRVDIACGVSYGDDLRKVKEIAVKAVDGSLECCESDEIEFYFTEFGDSSINFVLRFWHSETDKKSFFEQRHGAIVALKEAFDEAGIDIPFPIRTLDFGIKGGQGLGEVVDFKPNGQKKENKAADNDEKSDSNAAKDNDSQKESA